LNLTVETTMHIAEVQAETMFWSDAGLCYRLRPDGFVDYPCGDLPDGVTFGPIVLKGAHLLAWNRKGEAFTLGNLSPSRHDQFRSGSAWCRAERFDVVDQQNEKAAMKRRGAIIAQNAERERKVARLAEEQLRQ
jgi:hypothetical protein